MKRRAVLHVCITAALAALLFSGCQKHEQSREKPIYNTNSTTGSENSSISEPGDSITEPDDDTVESSLFSPDFKGITPTGEAPRAANSPFANISYYGTAPIVSYDGESETLYYVNYGGPYDRKKDYFLYSYRGGVSELLLEMPVNYPNYQNGSVYFTSNDDIDALYAFFPEYPEGKLYRYDVTDKTTELLVDENVFNLVVNKDYIYYTTSSYYSIDSNGNYIIDNDGKYIKEGGGENFRLPINGGEPEPIGDLLPFFYGEYQLRQNSTEDNLCFMELVSEDNAIRITGDFEYFRYQTYCIAEDKFWFQYRKNQKSQLASVDLRTGETKTYQHDSDVGILTYAVRNGELFAFSGSYPREIVRYDSEDEIFVIVDLSERHAQPAHILTDGKYAYVMYEITDGSTLTQPKRLLFLSRLIPLENGKYEEEIIY